MLALLSGNSWQTKRSRTCCLGEQKFECRYKLQTTCCASVVEFGVFLVAEKTQMGNRSARCSKTGAE